MFVNAWAFAISAPFKRPPERRLAGRIACPTLRAGGHRFGGGIDVGIEGEDAVDVDYGEGFGDQALGSADSHGAARLLHQAVGADQHSDAGAVDVVEFREIDDQFAGAGIDQFFEGGLDGLQCIAQAEAAGDGEDSDAGLDGMSAGLVDH